MEFKKFCNGNVKDHTLSAQWHPLQKHGVMGWNNKPLKELESTILNETNLPKYLWTDAVSITWYMMNRVLIRLIL